MGGGRTCVSGVASASAMSTLAAVIDALTASGTGVVAECLRSQRGAAGCAETDRADGHCIGFAVWSWSCFCAPSSGAVTLMMARGVATL